MRLAWAIGVAALLGACTASAADTGPATPASLKERLDRAKGGETIVLAPGDYGVVTLPARLFAKPLRIEAKDAVFTGIVVRGGGGLTIVGGKVIGPGGRSYGINIRDSRGVRVEGMTISGAHRGVVVNESSDIALVGNNLTGLISDGINIALSRKVLVRRNTCRNFSPTPGVYDAAGKRLRDGDHPDCIQAWSRPTAPPTADLTIEDNVMEGTMQGIFLGNHVRNGVDDGGFDRIAIRRNRITVSYPNGLTVLGGRGVTVTDNIVDTVVGARLPGKSRQLVKANLRIEGTGVIACGNRVSAAPRAPGQGPCPR